MSALEDYPRDLLDLEARFSTEESCRAYLARLRWPDGYRCPECSHDKAWPVRGTYLECAQCHHQASVTAGTIFQDTKKPLRLWFRAIWYVTSQKNGASALGLQRILGIQSYVTAWSWLHKLRRAMVRPGRDRLRGIVEVDETYVGGLEEGVSGRLTEQKALVAVAAEVDGGGMGRIRLQHIPDASACSLHTFVLASVESGSRLHTDGWDGYNGLEEFGYKRKVTVMRRRKEQAHELLPRVHRVASLLKRWILGTHQGAISHEHLGNYLDEFTFRFNRRTSQHRGKLFYRLLQQAMQTAPTPYATLSKGIRPGPERRPRRRRP
jgi:transposase-like protein